ncbi:S9 family peptidase [uncultured Fretibacterium sp.]|uniref:S9 family peptidase n=1 Tax=uncultured Fretibacterium sp. TaxID=1678694 RepID=UPI002619F74A|nr:S9 family peptidase [uncultured Fretibacterium sp.]
MNVKYLGDLLTLGAALGLLLPFAGAAEAGAKSAPLLPMEDFFRNPESAAYAISPDGRRLAYAKPWKSRMNVFVRDLDSEEERRVTSAEERDVGGFFWKGNDRIVYVQDRGGDENFHVYITNVEGTASRDLTPFEKVRAGVLDDLEDDPRHMLISMNQRDPEVFDVYRCDLDSGELTKLAENPGSVVGWMTDHEGRLRVAVETDGVNTNLLYRTSEDQEFRKLLTTSFKDSFDPILFSYDNRLLYVASNLSRDKEAIYTFDPEANKLLDLVYENDEVDVGGLMHSKKRKIVTGVHYTTDKTQYHYFDEESRKLREALEAFFPGHEVSVTDMDDEEQRCIVRVWGDRTRGAYYFYDRTSNALKKLADVSPWLREDDMSPMTPITYRSRDGLTIHGYLTIPTGAASRDLPLVVIPHGGPSAREYWGFDAEAQFLANRGAAVLQVNFRGSTGYGKKFWTAGFKQWGRAMQDDVTDGVKWAVDQGIADPKRLAIYGGSYGGYAALAGATFTPDLYACAVSYVGPSNLFTLLESIPPYWEPLRAMEYEEIGDPSKDKELLEAISPFFHADRIQIPLMVAQGANDPRVNKAESDQIVEAVRKNGREVLYMVKENEGHGFHNEENRFDFYRALEDFFRKHLGLR